MDLFCGIGGLTHGLLKAGVKVVAGYDLDASCRYAYEANNEGAVFHHADVTTLTAADLRKHYPEGAVRVLVGCAPCQPFSSLKRTSRAEDVQSGASPRTDLDDPAWAPLRHFGQLIEDLSPDVVSMENVTRLANRKKYPVYDEFIGRLERAGYLVTEYRPYGPDFGIPQRRRRLVVFASKHGSVNLVRPGKKPAPEDVSVARSLSVLPKLEHGQSDPNDRVHVVRRLTETNLKRVEASRPGGTWEDWPEALRLECHKKATGTSFASVYGRMDPEAPAPTITTQFFNVGTGRFVHPEQNRGLSLREGAILQTFPREYAFVEDGKPLSIQGLGRHIGNAVPPVLGRVIGRSILNHVTQMPLF